MNLKAPLYIVISVWILLIPVVIALGRWRRISRASQWTAGWLVSMMGADAAGRFWIWFVDPTSNLVVLNASLLVCTALLMQALAEWQANAVPRNAMHIALVLSVVGLALSFYLFEGMHSFSTVAYPAVCIFALTGALIAFASHAMGDAQPVLRSDWGWTLPAIAIYNGSTAAVTIVSQVALQRNDLHLIVNASYARATAVYVSLFLFTGALFWPPLARSSGTSSSPPASR